MENRDKRENQLPTMNQIDKNLKQSDGVINVLFIVIAILSGIVIGCAIMFICNKEAMWHYNVCQEKALLDSIAAMKTQKNWYIKEDSKGRLKVIELSNSELDSLSVIECNQSPKH